MGKKYGYSPVQMVYKRRDAAMRRATEEREERDERAEIEIRRQRAARMKRRNCKS
jgi:hypothetical protein